MPTATINITLSSVIDVLSSDAPAQNRASQAALKLQSNPPSVISQGPNGTLYVTDRVLLQFSFNDSTIRPIGIAFKAAGTNVGIGNQNMPYAQVQLLDPGSSHVNGPTIQVADTHASHGGKGAFKWEYYIVFQLSQAGYGAAAGAVGIIDPDVENDNPA